MKIAYTGWIPRKLPGFMGVSDDPRAYAIPASLVAWQLVSC